jgi:hypothetical protein
MTHHIENLLSLARDEGAALWSEGGSIHYRSRNPISQSLRALIIEHKPELLTYLVEWDLAAAISLMAEADAMIASNGISGLDVMIQSEAMRCSECFGCADMTGVRSSCALAGNRVRQLVKARAAA